VEEEFGRFVAARGRSLCRTAYLLTGDWQVGEDLVQEALTRTYLRRRTLRSAEALEPYARKVLVTLFLSSRRRLWHRELPFASVPDRASTELLDAAEDRRALWPALQKLSAQQRAVLVLRYFEDLTEGGHRHRPRLLAGRRQNSCGARPGEAAQIDLAGGVDPMNDLEDLLRQELRARVDAAEARQEDEPLTVLMRGLDLRIRRARIRRRCGAAGLSAMAVGVAIAVPLALLSPAAPHGNRRGGAHHHPTLQLTDIAATPGGWATVANGDAQLSVPPTWLIAPRPVCGRVGRGYVVIGKASTSLVVRNPRCKQASNMAAIQVLPAGQRPPQGRAGEINGIRVIGARPVARGYISFYVPALHARVTARGPLANKVLGTLTRSPFSVVLEAGPRFPVPHSWRWHDFGGIRFATPARWRTIKSRLWYPCWAAITSAKAVELVNATRTTVFSCSSDPGSGMRPRHGVVVGAGQYVAPHQPARDGCRLLHGLRACFAMPGLGGVLELVVDVPGRHKPTVVDIGLKGSGLEARTIFESIGPR
jgi:RNA polymerase sigma factor (sigma-70 family)